MMASNCSARQIALSLRRAPSTITREYSAQLMVGDAVFSPKYLPCATTECLRTGANLDMSDPGTQAYVRALDQQVFKDIGKGATIGTLVTPVGIPGAALGVTGAAAALGEAALSSNPISTGIDKGIETGSEKGAETFFRDVLGHSPGVAARAAALINLAGGWEAFRARVNTDLLGIPSNDQKKEIHPQENRIIGLGGSYAIYASRVYCWYSTFYR